MKNMKIEFKFISKKHIEIMGISSKIKKKIGDIFTPSGSGHTTMNAIQVCGFKEAYDLWGCANYETPRLKRNNIEYEYDKVEIIDFPYELIRELPQKEKRMVSEAVRKANLKKHLNFKRKKLMMNLKDIQLLFPYPSESREVKDNDIEKMCWGCFNNNCTCERKTKYNNPYTIKREQDLHIIQNIKKKKKT